MSLYIVGSVMRGTNIQADYNPFHALRFLWMLHDLVCITVSLPISAYEDAVHYINRIILVHYVCVHQCIIIII